MEFKIETKSYSRAPVDYGEVVRYAGAKAADKNLKSLIESCVAECEKENAVNYAVRFALTPVSINGDTADFSAFSLTSRNLVSALRGAKSALIFACTIGVGIDRLIKKYSEINPARALVLQALGAERVETFTDFFIADYAKIHGVNISPRFSPGYGDLSLSAQKDLFNLLEPPKHLGLTLNDSLLMSPSKSITAIAGIDGFCVNGDLSCKNCGKEDCGYRR